MIVIELESVTEYLKGGLLGNPRKGAREAILLLQQHHPQQPIYLYTGAIGDDPKLAQTVRGWLKVHEFPLLPIISYLPSPEEATFLSHRALPFPTQMLVDSSCPQDMETNTYTTNGFCFPN